MMGTLKAEFRKILSVRSTYYILGICLAALGIFAFYAQGIRAVTPDLLRPDYLASQVTQAISALAAFIGLVGLLLLTHEYRHNTIVYTLTAAKSRTQVLLAKVLAVSVFSILVTLIVSVLSPLVASLGIHLAGHHLAPQTLQVGTLLWHNLLYGWGMAMMALLFAGLIRNQVGAIVAFLLIPGPVEALAGLLLKKNTVYLPFSALNQVLASPEAQQGGPNAGHLSPGKAALVFMVYLVVGWLVAWYLFVKRDAS